MLCFDAAIERGEEAFPMALFDAIEHGIILLRSFVNIVRSASDLAHAGQDLPAYLSQLESECAKERPNG